MLPLFFFPSPKQIGLCQWPVKEPKGHISVSISNGSYMYKMMKLDKNSGILHESELARGP